MRKVLPLCAAMLGLLVLATWTLGQPQPAVPPAGKAAISIRVPANAEVTINGVGTTQRGRDRLFYTQTLELGYKYGYQFEARWTEGGVEKKASRLINVRAGDAKFLDLTAAEQVGTPKKEKDPGVDKKKDPVIDKKKKPDPDKQTGKTRKFHFTYAGSLKDLKPGTEASVWLPLPTSTSEQEVSIFSKDLPGEATPHQEKQYGNRMLFFKAKANDDGEIPFKVVYSVLRREVRTDRKGNLYVKPRANEPVDRFLQPDKLVPTSGRPLELLKDVDLKKDQFAAAKQMYDLVNEHMKYSKEGKGWGRGDSVWACDSKFGNCTDFHSLFISMARGNKIASKFEMGFPVPPKRGAGAVGGYHCWAFFMPEGKGWIPVDISEANRNPDLKEYYFGNLTEDRVQFTTGRDIDLEPRQKGPALNFFIYPYAEVQGKTHPQENITRTFSYEDVSSNLIGIK